MKIRLWGATALFVAVAAVSFGDPVELYSAEDFQLTGAGSATRSQRFSPTESSPNFLGSGDSFDTAGCRIELDLTESLDMTLELFTWNTDCGTTSGGTPLASATFNGLTAPLDQWFEVTASSALPATGQYMLHITATYDGGASGNGWGLYRSNSDDGGPNNDAYTNCSGPRTDRDYQVRLSGGSLPVECWELY